MHGTTTTIRTSALVAATALALGFWTHAIAQAAHTHRPDAVVQALTLNAGQRWATDEHLRKAMGTIRDGMNASLQDIHRGTLADAKYGALAEMVNAEVSFMVSNCRLEPKADAQLHLLIAELLEGADAMAGKRTQGTRQHGAQKVIGALEDYDTYFDDPGWKPLQH